VIRVETKLTPMGPALDLLRFTHPSMKTEGLLASL
jgi:hypothetical protein